MKRTLQYLYSSLIIILNLLLVAFSIIFFCNIWEDCKYKTCEDCKCETSELVKEIDSEKFDSTILSKDSLYVSVNLQMNITADSTQWLKINNIDSIKVQTDSLTTYIKNFAINNKDSIPERLAEIQGRLSSVEKDSKNITKKFENIRKETDLIIDKNSQWVGFWLSIIGIVLTISTILQVYANYRSNTENKETIKKTIHELELSTKSNKISCVTSCISNIPELYNFAPEGTRRDFINKFLKILHNEYSDYIIYIGETIPLEWLTTKELKKELDYIYLSWSQIEVAIHNIICCYDEFETNIEYQTLTRLLNEQITSFHNNSINSKNIIESMSKINDALNDFMRTIQ